MIVAGGMEVVILAYLLDRIVGDPSFLPHPVVGMGHLITLFEKWLRPLRQPTPRKLFGTGLLLTVLVVVVVYFITWVIVSVAYSIHLIVGIVISAWLVSTTVAEKGLVQAAKKVYIPLRKGQIHQARSQVAMIVGRDTDQLSEQEITRATVETVAENVVDAVVSPLFFALIGGAPLAMVYRAVNTMDSMIGYRNEKYEYFGKAAARIDDLMNWIPARIAAGTLLLASFILRYQTRLAWRSVRRDAGKHPSPNSGLPEAVVAGALGIQLGGLNYYKGVASHRATMGQPVRPMEREDILRAARLIRTGDLILLASLLMIEGFYI